MTHKYEVGDTVVAYVDPNWTFKQENHRYNGEECVIVNTLAPGSYMLDGVPEYIEEGWYRVQFGDDVMLYAKENELRRVEDDTWVKQKIANLLDFPLPRDMLDGYTNWTPE